MDKYILELDAFIRSVGVNRNSPHALFLGAGASISSGIPSAGMCIWEWKRDIFLTNNPGLEPQFTELSLPSVQQRIQRWLDTQGRYPESGSAEEYSYYIEQCFPISKDRQTYFQEKVRAARAHIGYRLMCLMAESEIIRSVWTTNFDGLVARAAGNFKLTPIEVGIDCQERLPRQPRKGELLCVSMHGDYRYDPLKNTVSEIQEQEMELRRALVKHLEDTSLIVCGYSGRDESVMGALAEAYSKKGPGALYWCGYDDEIPPPVRTLIGTARANGRKAYFVPTQGFDDLMVRLSLHCLSREELETARSIVSESLGDLKSQWSPFSLDDLPVGGLIKSNAFEVGCPSEVFEFDVKEWPEKEVWKWLKGITEGREVIAVPYRKVLCFGLLDEIKEAFGDYISGLIKRSPISKDELRIEDGAVMSLMRQALVRSMAEKADLNTNGRDHLWEKSLFKSRREGEHDCLIYESAIVFLRNMSGRMFVILKPSLMVESDSGRELPLEIINKVKLDILGWQHNKPFNQAMKRWRERILTEKPQTVFEYPPESGSTFRFRVRQAPVFASIGSMSLNTSIPLDARMQPHIKQTGILLDEPDLLFSNKQASGHVKDTHPIRGIVNNQPFDYSLTQQGLAPNVSIGVVCTAAESRMLETYLHKSQSLHQPHKTEQDYLLDYPGFDKAFGLPLELPRPGGLGWVSCPELDRNLDKRAGSLELSRILTKAISALEAACKPHVIIVFVPTRWKNWTGFETDDERFDLHDFVKAYCVQRGIATQFLEQETFADKYQCRVWWWLSVALYAKAMRTPWVLDSLDPSTAFVGLGFTIDRKADKRKQVVLGCSHLYNAQGEGLQFRLSKIENPVIIKDNPFMSHDDARRVGETIRYLFYDSRMKLPDRVVIHKLTPFRKDEREGLQEGLSGVAEVDMLEINVDSALRYVSSVARHGGGFDEDNFPVRRGTTVQLDDYTALLWVHGVTDAVKPGWKYYQGKRRIPAPAVLRRHAGRSSLSVVANEILGLSKMDWNSADLYSKLPATVHSSKQIARIGALLQRFGPVSYDYRLFI